MKTVRFLCVFLIVFLTSCGAVSPSPTPAEPITTPTAEPTTPAPLPSPTEFPKATLVTRLGKGIAEAITWSPDGTYFAVASSSGVHLYGGDTLVENEVIAADEWVTSISFSDDSRLLAVGEKDGDVGIWNLATGNFSRSLAGTRSEISSLAFSPDNSIVAIGKADSTLWLWDLNSGQVRFRLRGHQDRLTAVDFSKRLPAGNQQGYELTTASRDGTVLAWDTGSGRSTALLNLHEGAVTDTIYNPLPPGIGTDNERVTTAGEDGKLYFWSPANNQLLLVLNNSEKNIPVRAISYTSDGGILAAGDRDGNVSLWNGITGEPYRAFPAHPGAQVLDLAYQPGSTFLATLGTDSLIRIWNAPPVTDPEQTEVIPVRVMEDYMGAINDLAYESSRGWLATAHADGAVRLWDLNSGRQLATWRAHEGAATSVVFSPAGVLSGGDILVSGGNDGSLRFWDLAGIDGFTEPLRRTLLGHRNLILQIAFNPAGSRIASVSADGSLRLWDSLTGQTVSIVRRGTSWLTSITYSPDGHWLAAGDENGQLQVWDVSSGSAPLPNLVPFTAHQGAVLVTRYNPDSSALVSAGNDGQITMWEAAGQTRTGERNGHSRRVSGLSFSADGELLASASADGSIRLWTMETNQELSRIEEKWPVNKTLFVKSQSLGYEMLISGSSDGTLRAWSIPSIHR